MASQNSYPKILDVFLKNNFVWKFFAVLIAVYALWNGFPYFKTLIEIREASEYFYAKDYVTAYQKIQIHAMNGDLESRYQLGVMTAFGLGAPKDKMLATLWLDCSNTSGCIKGRNEYRLAVGCIQGEWGKYPEDECVLWMKYSAQAGYQDAMVWLDHYASQKKEKN